MDYQTALDFTATVRSAFVNEPWVFDAFLVVLSEYRKQAIDLDDLMLHMRAIFQSHESLFDQFCSFLPQDDAPCCPSALDFVSYVKARCVETTPDVYHRFLALLSSVERGQLAVPEMYTQTCALFQKDSELLTEFECFFHGEWTSDESLLYPDNVSEDNEDELDHSRMPSITSSPSPSVESFAGVQTPVDSGSPLPRSINLKNSSAYEYQAQSVSATPEWSS